MPWIKSCLCQQEKKKPPTISPPVHLMLKPESSTGPSHAFRCKVFKKPRPCHLCHQPILNQGSCCRVCKYVCHKVCESKEAADRFMDTSWQIHKQWSLKSEKSNKENGVKTLPNGIVNEDCPDGVKNGTINKKLVQIETVQTTCERKNREKADIILHTHEEPVRSGPSISRMQSHSSFNDNTLTTTQPRSSNIRHRSVSMDLSYVTERIIALWFPGSSTNQNYRQGQRHAAHMLRNKHGDNYMVFNLSEPKRVLRSEHKHVKEVGWPLRLAPPLERLCWVCKEIESWLSVDNHRIAVLHARGSKDKLGVVVAAYMHYSSICGSADQALDRFSMRKFLEESIGPLQLPSNKRYVDYFAGLLSHNIKVNAAPLFLTHVTVLGAPAFYQGGCRAFLKLYEGLTPVYTSGVYSVSSGVKQFTVNIAAERRPGLQLRGDILLKCYHRGVADREMIFACQFHTCAVTDYTLSFTRQELDGASNDARFPVDGAVELHFSAGPEGRFSTPAPTPAVPVTSTTDPVTRADSPLQLEESEDDDSDAEDVSHTFGPLDGSIYATIAKKPEQLSPGAVGSPLTVSMDSGISSAGHQQNVISGAASSPPPTAQPSPLSPEEQHRELDELLSDMMLTVQSIPDVKPSGRHLHISPIENDVRYIDEDDDKDIPYHARQDSRPFSYGVDSNMIADSKKLSSPSLVRKASFNKSSGDTLKKVQTQVYPDAFSTPKSNFIPSSTYHEYNPPKDPIDDIFTPSALRAANQVYDRPQTQPYRREFTEGLYKDERYEPMKRSHTDGSLKRTENFKTSSTVTSPYSDPESLSPPGAFRTLSRSPEFHETYATGNNLTWLQKQQLKLKERREMQLREERQPHETRLLSELKSVQNRHLRPSASHRVDGYTSDTTAFADDDEDFTIPLHINTRNQNSLPSRGMSSNYSTLKSYSSTTSNERPFMSVKRAHEKYSQNAESSPASILSANPMGHVVRPPSRGRDSTDGGLLSLVERERNISKQFSRQVHSPLVGMTQQMHNGISKSPSARQTHQDALADLISSLSNGSDHINGSPNAWQYREDSISSWRTQSASELESSPPRSTSPRPQTPAFPVQSRTPYANASTPTVQFDLSERLPPKSPTTQRRVSYPAPAIRSTKRWSSVESKDRPVSPSDRTNGIEYPPRSMSATPSYREHSETYQTSRSPVQNGSASPTVYYGSRRSSVHSESPQEVSPAHVKFVRDTSNFWYKPTITREEAINMLRNQSPGTFVVRDSNSFPGAFGLAVKVATLPTNIQTKTLGSEEYVRHFLIEPTSRGVRLKGCQNEPVFSSLSALIYQHSVMQMALPCRLVLPEGDIKIEVSGNPAQQLLTQGAACNVLYLFSADMESLTGPQAVRKAVLETLQKAPLPVAAIVHFKVNGQGVTLTDSKRKLFFRRHYPINTISHCGLDPDEHRWSIPNESGIKSQNRIFGFVARKLASNADNQCHVFAELEPEQPATAIVNFVNKILSSAGTKTNML